MSVVNDMGTDMDDEPDPTWEEAVAAFEAAEPVEVVRPPRTVNVVYQYAAGVFTATSPELRGLRMTGRSLDETMGLVRASLDGWLDPAVTVEEHLPAPEPQVSTSSGGFGWLKGIPLSAIARLSSTGAGRAFVSAARAGQQRAGA
jgi:predicted RNase H-like HicB family nuclease